MNSLIIDLKTKMNRAMQVYVLMLYEAILESKAEFVLEIGTGQAQSSRAMLSAMKENGKGKLITVDIKGRGGRFTEDLKPYFEHLVGDSHSDEILNRIKTISPIYDFLIIDGDHTCEGAKKDFEMYYPLVKKGGLIFMHDVTNPNEGVKDFWKEINLPKIELNYGWRKYGAGGFIPGMGIIQKQ